VVGWLFDGHTSAQQNARKSYLRRLSTSCVPWAGSQSSGEFACVDFRMCPATAKKLPNNSSAFDRRRFCSVSEERSLSRFQGHEHPSGGLLNPFFRIAPSVGTVRTDVPRAVTSVSAQKVRPNG